MSGHRLSIIRIATVFTAAGALGAATEAEAALYYWQNSDTGYYRPSQPMQPRRQKIRRNAGDAKKGKQVEKEAPSTKPQGALIISISIDQQKVRVYDTNGLFAEGPVSTGMKGHPTPMGVFSIIQKHKMHHSNIYSGAPMPFMQRITWSGVAMHQGVLPGYPASHGCIRMPAAFAQKMWNWTKMGARVFVTPGEMTPATFSHPLLITQRVVPVAEEAPQVDAPLGVKSDKGADAKSEAKTMDTADIRIELRSTLGHALIHTADASGVLPANAAVTMSDASPAAASGEAAAVKPSEPAATVAKPETVVTEPAKVEAKPVEAKPVEAKALEAKPDDAQPATAKTEAESPTTQSPATKNAEAAPADKPTEAKPAEIVTGEIKPAPADDKADAKAEAAASVKAEDKAVEPKSDAKAEAKVEDAKAEPSKAEAAKTEPAKTESAKAEPAKSEPAKAEAAKPDTAKPAEPKAAEKPAEPAKATADAPAAKDNSRLPSVEKAAKPELKREGQVAVFISRKDGKLYIRQNFKPVLDVPVTIAPSDRLLGTHVFTAETDKGDPNLLRWSVVSLPVTARNAQRNDDEERSTRRRKVAGAPPVVETKPAPAANSPAQALDRITIPADVMAKIAEALTTGGSIVVSDQGIAQGETGEGTDFIIRLR